VLFEHAAAVNQVTSTAEDLLSIKGNPRQSLILIHGGSAAGFAL